MSTTISTMPNFPSIEEELIGLVRALHATHIKTSITEFSFGKRLSGGKSQFELDFEYTPDRKLKKIIIKHAHVTDLNIELPFPLKGQRLLVKELAMTGGEITLPQNYFEDPIAVLSLNSEGVHWLVHGALTLSGIQYPGLASLGEVKFVVDAKLNAFQQQIELNQVVIKSASLHVDILGVKNIVLQTLSAMLVNNVFIKVNRMLGESQIQLSGLSHSGKLNISLGHKQLSFEGDMRAGLVELKQSHYQSEVYLNTISNMGNTRLKFMGLSAILGGSLKLAQASFIYELQHGINGIVAAVDFEGNSKIKYANYQAKLAGSIKISEGKISKRRGYYQIWMQRQSPVWLKGTISNEWGAKIKLHPGMRADISKINFGPNYLMARGSAQLLGSYVPNEWNPDSAVRVYNAQGGARKLTFKCKRQGIVQFLPKAKLGDNNCQVVGE